MKRYVVVAVSLVLVASLGLALTGCGGDTGKAKEYIKNADAIIEEVEKNSGDMEEQFQVIGTELSSGDITSAQAKKLAEDMEAATEDLIAEAQEAAKELAKVSELENVDDYQEYAELRISVIEGIIALIEETESYLTDLSQTLAAAESGQPVDEEAFLTKSNDFAARMGELQEQIETDGEKADELQKKL